MRTAIDKSSVISGNESKLNTSQWALLRNSRDDKCALDVGAY